MLLAACAALGQDFSTIPFAVAGSVDYAAISKGYDPKLVSKLVHAERRLPGAPPATLGERPILAPLALDDGPDFMKLANSIPTAACHPKASRGRHSPRTLGMSATDTSAKIGAACYQRF